MNFRFFSKICLSQYILLAGAFCSNAASLANFETLNVFSGREQVRIAATLRAEESGAVRIVGRITSAQGGAMLWEGPIAQVQTKTGTVAPISGTVSNLNPKLWSPVSPTLYFLELVAQQGGKTIASKKVRFGFRSFEVHNGQFELNGEPVFLRGVAINPPGRGIPDNVGESRKFAEDYVRFLKSQNLNIFRISTNDSQVWFDVCDELGMMVYAGRYGAPPESMPGLKSPPADFEKSIASYKKLFEGFASHPSIVVYYLSNELPFAGERGEAYHNFLERACAEMKIWDSTRPYIGNAGYGVGREGDVCDVHRYWGWYYNSFLTYYNLRDRLFSQPLFGDPEKNQPLTFSECVGSFTGSSGKFNLVRSKQLAPSLGWIGHTEMLRDDALAYQAFMTKQACESFRRMRSLNPRLSGIMPFTILFYNWSGISSFNQMEPKPVMDAMRTAYQPVLLSWELWTPQVYAGSQVPVIAHIVNDDDRKRVLKNATLTYSLQNKGGSSRTTNLISVPAISYYGTWRTNLTVKLPADLQTGNYQLVGTIKADGQVLSKNFADLFVAGDEWKNAMPSTASIRVFDSTGKTIEAFKKLGINVEKVSTLTPWPAGMTTLVLGEKTWDSTLSKQKAALKKFVRDGGRMLILQPDSHSFEHDWLSEKISFFTSSPNDADYPPKSRPFREQMNVNPERPDHPVFRGLNRHHLSLWSDYSHWDQTKIGFPQIYPVTAGFKLEEPKALARTAILADYDRGLEGIALCELFDGKGSVILSGFDLVDRSGLDPIADRLLANLVSYANTPTGHEVYPLIEKPIEWGNYSTERGLIPGSLNGLVVNAEWVPGSTPSATKEHLPNTGSWNMLPGEQFEPKGRNPFGAYSYSTGSSLREGNPQATTGEGFFYAQFPRGKKFIVTQVKNPSEKMAVFKIFLNEGTEPAANQIIAPGQTVSVRVPLITSSTNVLVRYFGQKTLVLLETKFE